MTALVTRSSATEAADSETRRERSRTCTGDMPLATITAWLRSDSTTSSRRRARSSCRWRTRHLHTGPAAHPARVTRRLRGRQSGDPRSLESTMNPAVYVQTNDAADNEVVAFKRAEDGLLSPLGRYSTGGRGTGAPHLPSQNSIVLDDDGRWLLVVNAGSDELSLFAVKPDGLELTDRAASGGSRPTSVAISGTLAYVLNNATPNLAGFRIGDGRLVGFDGSA